MREEFLEAKREAESGLADRNTPIGPFMQCLSFRIDTQDFLIDAVEVIEIIMPPRITFVPGAGSCVEGVIAVRGDIIPVINLRRLLGFNVGALTQATRVLILRPALDAFGIIVDTVKDIQGFEEAEISPLAPIHLSQKFRVVSGMARTGTLVRPIIDARKVFDAVFSNGVCDAD